VEHGRRLGRSVRVTALDRDPVAAAFASRKGREGVEVVRADAFSLPFPEKSFDLVTASLFLHHFRHPEAALLLSAFRRVARRAVVINELRRNRIPWAFISVASRATFRSPMFVHDAPLSVLRGFTAAELSALATDAGAPGSPVRRSWPFRLLLILPAEAPAR
jgi:ubiquinone/menaquinone biosynthesis C-methylase UbiE